MTPNARRTYHAQFLRWHTQQERIALRLVLVEFNRTWAQVASQLDKAGPDVLPALLDLIVTDSATTGMLERIYTTVGVNAAQRQYDALVPAKKSAPVPMLQKDKDPPVLPTLPNAPQSSGMIRINPFSQVWRNKMVQLARSSETALRVSGVTAKTKQLIRDVLTRGAEQRWDIRKIAKNLKSVIVDKARAMTIARTETTRAASAGAEAGAMSTNLLLNKIWIATNDFRTRDTHRAAGQQKPVARDGRFKVGEALMLYPGDPAGGARECANCFLPDELTHANKQIIKKAFRAFYEGDLVTIKTSGNRGFTCTPNHPILTTDGWVKAGLLTNAHQLVKSSTIELMGLSDFDVNNVPATFEQVFNSLLKEFGRVGVAGVDVNFYGDVPTGDVDVVDTEGQLRDGLEVELGKMINHLLLKRPDNTKRILFSDRLFGTCLFVELFRHVTHLGVSFSDDLLLFFKRCVPESLNVGLATAPLGLPSVAQNSRNGITASIVLPSKCQLTDAISVLLNDFFDWKQNAGLTFGNKGASLDAVILENLADGSDAATVLGSKLAEWATSNVLFDDVTLVEFRKGFSGHVYTLETYNQIYDINTYIARNCRCTLAYIPAINPLNI